MTRCVISLVVVGMLLVAGCSANGSDGRVLDVSAAASLSKTFTAIADEFERQHDGVDVRLSFDGSSTLANQIRQGAPADVFASADQRNMSKLGELAVDPEIFATNTLVIVTAPGNPKNVRSLADLTKPGITTVVCQVAQPCGAATDTVVRRTGITIDAVSEEQSVSAVLTKVATGQADAGVVYVTDARAAGDQVTTVNDPAFATVVNDYPIAVIADADDHELASQFRDLVLGEDGRRILRDAGFGVP
ncbi:molybdate ABC transporter substrate-binding protein [Gordonia sp. CNJ-863]|uniref:molybdate ABC transporter substrate-binding protein n=1 Tax=Gordonia sp. Swx-4 TaxID=3029399 RepID=UPI0005A898D3|nr:MULTISPECIES: molybdate ABC transporter substrate-binding protein [Gordonia]OLT44356.1 molybdate ABC transporter substrate-binding protein [Gordonia sp. CNJ-863]WJG13224.1 molybdate ABC transporter substrate-binding protein [Gordonia sp. Swx-4]